MRLVRALTVDRREAWLEDHCYLNMDLLGEYKKEVVTPSGLMMLSAKVRASFLASDRAYGAERVWHDILAEGMCVGGCIGSND